MATAAHSGQFHEKGQDCTISNGSSDLTTTHLYYADTYLFSNNARVVAIEEVELNGVKLTALVLDQTVMHPQGGGQPTDKGTVRGKNNASEFEVSYVQKPKGCGYIQHLGYYKTEARLSDGDQVLVEIDAAQRKYNARVHSAGHLLDSCFSNLGLTDLVPSKGYHFPDGPYVEYVGNVPAEKREEVIDQLNSEAARLIRESTPVQVSMNDRGERSVNVGGTECMCGGTHVKNTSEIVGLTVTKIKKSKKNIRVSYNVATSED